jgi:anti-sigma B factor antagonist
VAAVELEIDDRADAHGHATLKLTGELDAESVPVLERVVERQLATGARVLTLDLSELMFIDSAGLAAVVLVSQLCERDGRLFRIVRGTRAVQHRFEVTGLADVLPFVESPAGSPS